jgi:hypothetical protein
VTAPQPDWQQPAQGMPPEYSGNGQPQIPPDVLSGLARLTGAAGGNWYPGTEEQLSPESLRLAQQGYEADKHRLMRTESLHRDVRRELGAQGRQPVALVPGWEIRRRPKPPDLISGMMPLQGIGAMFGESGVYKSFLLLNLMLSIGAGRPFLGHHVSQAGWCVYVLGEGQADAGERLGAAILAGRGFTDERIAYIEQPFPLADQGAADELITQCRQLTAWSGVPVRLAGFDSLADFYGDGYSENAAGDTQQIVAGMKRISAALSCAVLVNAHSGHGGKDEDGGNKPPARVRGSSRWRQAFDFEWLADGSRIICTKNRYGPKFAPVPYATVPQAGSLVIAPPAIGSRPAAAPPEPEWPHPVTAGQFDRVVAAVWETPGRSMSAIAVAAGVRKEDTAIALLKADEMPGLIIKAGTEKTPKYQPGALKDQMRQVQEWLGRAG